jgi:hypothetical protein
MINALDEIRKKLRNDPPTMARLRDALERVSLNGAEYVSATDATSLRNWLIEIYAIPADEFDDVPIKDLLRLGRKILAGNVSEPKPWHCILPMVE